MQVVPSTVFGIVEAAAALHLRQLPELPGRLEVDSLRSAAALEPRRQLAHLTARVAAFTHGILTLDR